MTKQEIITALESYDERDYDDRERVLVVLNGMVRKIQQAAPYGQATISICLRRPDHEK